MTNQTKEYINILILGAGTGGTIMANRLRRRYSEARATITVVDQDEQHIYQPGLLFVPFGIYQPEEIVRTRSQQLHKGISYIQCIIKRVITDENAVELADGRSLGYDLLIVATGTRLLVGETEGLGDTGWLKTMFDFYTLEGATALRGAMEQFEEGILVINIVDMPIKCPVAPLEFAFLTDWYFHQRGIRDKVDIKFVTPLDGAFTRPVASKALNGMLEDKGVELITEFSTGEVDGEQGCLTSFDERTVEFDLLVSIPVHGGAAFIDESEGLGDELGFVITDLHTLQATCKENIFAIGDAANLPTSKAGSVTHFEADILCDNVERYLEGEPLEREFDGHANCFIETGFNKGLLIDFNYEVEPVPGKFPFAGIGPLPLLKESRINHIGKLMFHWFYWHLLLPGLPIPGVPSEMSLSGKDVPKQK
jgi:sulfide:quinone oxidoreductase